MVCFLFVLREAGFVVFEGVGGAVLGVGSGGCGDGAGGLVVVVGLRWGGRGGVGGGHWDEVVVRWCGGVEAFLFNGYRRGDVDLWMFV